ncbi:MAG: hypothetical protein FJ082_10840 [Cyanobacteria bacterium K_Offshore_surface_m2_011]|nr:hypothetical protein [Cyanobacteria bacterium K_Offshore_surface_m2_011]
MNQVTSPSRMAPTARPFTFAGLASKAVTAGCALAVGLAVAPAQAQVVLDKTTGTWSNHVGGTNIVFQTVGDEKQIRWGTSTGSGQSGLGFTGVDPNPNLVVPFESNFLLGTLRHFNNRIKSGTAASSVSLTLETLFTTPPLSIDFVYSSTIDETPNSGSCIYPSGDTPCADKITISTVPNQTFTFQGKTLTLASFFLDETGNPSDSLISQEGGTTTAQVFGRLTKAPNAPGDAVPGPLPVLGIAAAFGYSRKLRKRIQSNG